MILADVLQTSDLTHVDFIKRKYENLAVDYQLSISFFELFGLVSVKDNKINLKKKFLNAISDSPSVDAGKFKLVIIDGLLSASTHSLAIAEFLGLFDRVGSDMVLRLTTDERLRYSDLRNLSVELGLINYDSNTDTYVVAHNFIEKVDDAVEQVNKHALSAKRLAEILANQEIIGAEAELCVIGYERERLVSDPGLVTAIEHKALVDVAAGYDVLSWEIGTNTERFIEVKAVSINDYGFMWTINEIDCAKRLGKRYFLYLLPVIGAGKFDLTKLNMVQDPFNNVFMNEKEWTKHEKVYTISKASNSYEKKY